MTRTSPPWFSARILACSCLLGTSANASSAYPGRLQELTGAPCAPACVTCHRDRSGGLGTVRVAQGGTRFGEAMSLAGLAGGKPETLEPALEQLRRSGHDSDLDGNADVVELARGEDPSRRDEPLVCGPEYGCHAGPGTPDAGAVLLSLAAYLLRRRR